MRRIWDGTLVAEIRTGRRKQLFYTRAVRPFPSESLFYLRLITCFRGYQKYHGGQLSPLRQELDALFLVREAGLLPLSACGNVVNITPVFASEVSVR